MKVDPEKAALVRAHLPKHLRSLAVAVEKLNPRDAEGFASGKQQIMKFLEALAAIDEAGN